MATPRVRDTSGSGDQATPGPSREEHRMPTIDNINVKKVNDLLEESNAEMSKARVDIDNLKDTVKSVNLYMKKIEEDLGAMRTEMLECVGMLVENEENRTEMVRRLNELINMAESFAEQKGVVKCMHQQIEERIERQKELEECKKICHAKTEHMKKLYEMYKGIDLDELDLDGLDLGGLNLDDVDDLDGIDLDELNIDRAARATEVDERDAPGARGQRHPPEYGEVEEIFLTPQPLEQLFRDMGC